MSAWKSGWITALSKKKDYSKSRHASQGDFGQLQILLQSGSAGLNVTDGACGATLLHWACDGGHVEVLACHSHRVPGGRVGKTGLDLIRCQGLSRDRVRHCKGEAARFFSPRSRGRPNFRSNFDPTIFILLPSHHLQLCISNFVGICNVTGIYNFAAFL